MSALPLGTSIGVIGGGQLGRMLCAAGARLGYRTIVLDPDAECPAGQLANETIVAAYDDRAALADLARRCAVITYEFENVPVEPLKGLAAHVPVRPPVEALEVAQDRVVEKAFLNGIGIATARWRAIDEPSELPHAMLDLGGDCILKTRRLGYDGKGQAVLKAGTPLEGVFESLGGVPAILEKRVAFDREISIVAARGTDGAVAAFDPAENVHSGGILRRSTVPANISATVAEEARAIAGRILTRLDYVGVVGVEFFATADGLLVNEIAPRVHNSGHWTEALCAVSQFEQHMRAVGGLALGDPSRHSDGVMANLIGADIDGVPQILREPGASLTLYGKAEARPGRKMGHVTRLTLSAKATQD